MPVHYTVVEKRIRISRFKQLKAYTRLIRHCKCLILPSTDTVLCLYSPLYKIALPIPHIRCCWLNYPHF